MKFSVGNMSCNHCIRAITRALNTIDAQARVVVDLAGGTVTVDRPLDPASAIAAMADAGYPAQVLPATG